MSKINRGTNTILNKIISNLSDALDHFPVSIETAFSELSSLKTINVEVRDNNGTATLTFVDKKLISTQFKPKGRIPI